jgi:hypothetical protein
MQRISVLYATDGVTLATRKSHIVAEEILGVIYVQQQAKPV